MRRIWIPIALMGLAGSVVLVISWIARDRKTIEPATRPEATSRVQAKRLARPKPSGCSPVAGGGYTCGTCRDDADCPPQAGCIVNLESGRTECRGSECTSNEWCATGALCRVFP